MRTYEVLFILSAQLADDETTTLINEFKAVAEKAGARLATEEAWGRRRLASPIGKINEGIYHLFVFESEGDVLNELDRRMKNSDRVLRHMIVRTDEAHKRAAKLAKRNPKKERQRPSPAMATDTAAPVAAPTAAPVAEPVLEAPAQPAGDEPAAE